MQRSSLKEITQPPSHPLEFFIPGFFPSFERWTAPTRRAIEDVEGG
jgi:hypothetical protein